MGDRRGAKKLIQQAKEIFTKDKSYYITQIISSVWVIDIPTAVATTDEARTKLNRDSDVAYQSQRAYLMAGHLEKAKAAMQVVLGGEAEEVSKIMMQLRQACASRNVERADELYKLAMNLPELDKGSSWLFAQTMGKTKQADAIIRPLDQPGRLIELASFLYYYHFELERYPNLQKLLEIQGINRPPSQPVMFGCGREDKINSHKN